jgi:hypothetical protein
VSIKHAIKANRWHGGNIRVYSLCFVSEVVTYNPNVGGVRILYTLSVVDRLHLDKIRSFIFLFCYVVLLLKLRRLY